MEDKRTALAIFVCILVIMVYSELFLAPVTRPVVQSNPVTTSINAPTAQVENNSTAPAVLAENQVATTNNSTLPTSGTTSIPARKFPTPAEIQQADETIVDSNEANIHITHLGARLRQFQLKQYRLHIAGEELVDLVSSGDTGVLPLGVILGNTDDAQVKYSLASVSEGIPHDSNTFRIPESGELTLRFTGTLPSGIAIEKSFVFRPGTYLFDVKVTLAQAPADGSRVALEWSSFAPDSVLNGRLDPPQFTYLNNSRKLFHLLAPEITKTAQESGRPLSDLGPLSWLALSTKYFMSTVIPRSAAPSTLAGIENNILKSRTYGDPASGEFSIYVGPKDYKLLTGMGFELHRSIDLGWFAFLAFPLISVIRFFYHILGNYGLAIILLTLMIKALFLPLTKASFKSMKAMQEIQPEVKALRERIKDATQLNQEMMALYKRRGVNPMGGCFPILIQLPVFLGLYNALLNSIELRHAPFALWIEDLSAPESLMLGGFGIPVMVLLMGASMFLQQLTTPSTGDPAQRKAMLMMPIVFTVMFVIFPFPAGLVLYWLVNNVISITQQMFLNQSRRVNPLQATLVASLMIFCFGWVLTLI